jgi:DNA-binding ferritin-like protein
MPRIPGRDYSSVVVDVPKEQMDREVWGQQIQDNNETTVAPEAMLAELLNDNRLLTSNMRSAHELFAGENDFATTSLIENWIDETESRI